MADSTWKRTLRLAEVFHASALPKRRITDSCKMTHVQLRLSNCDAHGMNFWVFNEYCIWDTWHDSCHLSVSFSWSCFATGVNWQNAIFSLLLGLSLIGICFASRHALVTRFIAQEKALDGKVLAPVRSFEFHIQQSRRCRAASTRGGAVSTGAPPPAAALAESRKVYALSLIALCVFAWPYIYLLLDMLS